MLEFPLESSLRHLANLSDSASRFGKLLNTGLSGPTRTSSLKSNNYVLPAGTNLKQLCPLSCRKSQRRVGQEGTRTTLKEVDQKTQLNNCSNIKELYMKNGIEHSKAVSQSEIAVVAYGLWETAGHPASRDLQFWLEAEAQLCAAAKTATTPPAAHLSALDPKNNPAHNPANVPLGLSRADSSKSRQNIPRF